MSTLKLSAPDWCFYKKAEADPEDYYQRLKAIGYDAVEMVDPERFAAAQSAGLRILNMAGPGMQEGLNRVENHAKLVPEIEACIEQARENDIESVIIFSGNRDGQADDVGQKNCIQAVERLAPVAEAKGVTLLFEMLNSFNHKDYQADHGRYGFDLARAINSPAVKVLYDIYHLHRMGENVLDQIVSNLDLIAHLHVAGAPKRDFPGADQETDYASLVPQIQQAGYNAYWGMEFVPQGNSLDELEKAATLFGRYAETALPATSTVG